MIEECPHCYTEVLPTPDGCCPSCRQKLDAPSAADPNLTMVRLDEGQKMPACCIICGQATDEIKTMNVSVGVESNADVATAANMLGCLTLLFLGGGVFMGGRGSNKQSLHLQLPVCPRCTGDPRLEAKHIDFENRRAKFLVHRTFAEALEK